MADESQPEAKSTEQEGEKLEEAGEEEVRSPRAEDLEKVATLKSSQ